MKNYIVSYDIREGKRLARLARYLEKYAMRIQNSVFYLASVNQNELLDIIKNMEQIIDLDEDDVRVYTVLDAGIALGQAVNLENPFIF